MTQKIEANNLFAEYAKTNLPMYRPASSVDNLISEIKYKEQLVQDKIRSDQFIEELNQNKSYFSETNNMEMLKIVSETCKNDKEYLINLANKVTNNGTFNTIFHEIYSHVNLVNDYDIASAILQKERGQYFYFLSRELTEKKEIVILALNNSSDNHYSWQIAYNNFLDDKEVMLKAVSLAGYCIADASERLRDDKDIVLAAVKSSGKQAYKHASDNLKNDPDIIAAKNKYESGHMPD
jgi:hypothetical protein